MSVAPWIPPSHSALCHSQTRQNGRHRKNVRTKHRVGAAAIHSFIHLPGHHSTASPLRALALLVPPLWHSLPFLNNYSSSSRGSRHLNTGAPSGSALLQSRSSTCLSPQVLLRPFHSFHPPTLSKRTGTRTLLLASLDCSATPNRSAAASNFHLVFSLATKSAHRVCPSSQPTHSQPQPQHTVVAGIRHVPPHPLTLSSTTDNESSTSCMQWR